MEVNPGSTNVSVPIRCLSTAGAALTGKLATNFTLWYKRAGANGKTNITLADLATLTTAHTDGGIKEISDGWYRLDVPDAAFASGAQTVVLGGTVAGGVVLTAPISLRNANVTFTPVQVNVSAGAVTDSEITQYRYAAFGPFVFTITDDDDEAVDLSGVDLEFRVYAYGSPDTVLWTLTSNAGEISVGGSSSNQVAVSDDDTHTGTAGLYRYVLWDTTNDLVRARGTLTIVEEADAA